MHIRIQETEVRRQKLEVRMGGMKNAPHPGPGRDVARPSGDTDAADNVYILSILLSCLKSGERGNGGTQNPES